MIIYIVLHVGADALIGPPFDRLAVILAVQGTATLLISTFLRKIQFFPICDLFVTLNLIKNTKRIILSTSRFHRTARVLNMDSYLIRIYRRDKENPEAIVGIIEEIGTEKKQSFKNVSELCKIIVHRRDDKRRRKKK